MICMETIGKIKRLYHKEGLSKRAIVNRPVILGGCIT